MRFCPKCELETDKAFCPKDDHPTVDKNVLGDDELAGRLLAGRYRLLKLLGEGSCGSLYQACELNVGRTVALRLIPEQLSTHVAFTRRFHKEVRKCTKLEHPNTVRVFDFGQADDGTLFYTMQFLKGVTLSEFIRANAPLPEQRFCTIVIQILKSLSEAHGRGVFHGDLSPSSVFMAKVRGEIDFVKVLDVGIGRLVHGDDRRGTSRIPGRTLPKPKYISPEQAQGQRLDARSDLYALGVVMYEMLTGSAPFDADAAGVIRSMHVNNPVPPLPPGLLVTQETRDLVMQLLKKQRAKRPDTADEIVNRIADLMMLDPGQSGLFRLPGVVGPPQQPAEETAKEEAVAEAVEEAAIEEEIAAPVEPPPPPPGRKRPSLKIAIDAVEPFEAEVSEKAEEALEAALEVEVEEAEAPPPVPPPRIGRPLTTQKRKGRRKTSIAFGLIGLLLLLGLAAVHIISNRTWPLGPEPAKQDVSEPGLRPRAKPVDATQQAVAAVPGVEADVSQAPVDVVTPKATVDTTLPPVAAAADTGKPPAAAVADTQKSPAVAAVDTKKPPAVAAADVEVAAADVKQVAHEDTVAPAAAVDTTPPRVTKLPKLLVITSEPSRAAVLIRGKRVGKTPYRYRWRRRKQSQKLTIRLPGYDPVTLQLQRKAGEKTRHVVLELTKITRIATSVRCVVWIDGKRMGKTPMEYKWEEGKEFANMKLVRTGYRSIRTRLERRKHMGRILRFYPKKQ